MLRVSNFIELEGAETKKLEVICFDKKLHPLCPHGPTLLFRINESGKLKEYFACSAFRNRQGCNFFMTKTDWLRNAVNKNSFKTCVDIVNLKNIRDNVLHLKTNKLGYCHQCNVLFNDDKLHQNHDSINMSLGLQETPTKFLRPLNNDKAEAQYFFTEATLKFITTILAKLNVSKVVCIGVPRIHEHLKKLYDILRIQSILLDIDHRFFFFNSESEYFYYNMFNHYFFEGKEKKDMFDNFLKISKNEIILLITDPPFGCRTEPLASVLKEISCSFRKMNKSFLVLPIIWVFPYFMEHYIKNEMPEMDMIDYKVNYINHIKYNGGLNARKFGSPVRLFTNIPLNLIELPESEGYIKCDICQKWTFSENIHCNICNICPSKNGETYRHCMLCAMCVKPNYIHCKECRRCTQKQNHVCAIFQKKAHCWICKNVGHLEKYCVKRKKSFKEKYVKIKEVKNRICSICLVEGHNENKCDQKNYKVLKKTKS